jgi:hypothetical protein
VKLSGCALRTPADGPPPHRLIGVSGIFTVNRTGTASQSPPARAFRERLVFPERLSDACGRPINFAVGARISLCSS